VYNGQTVLAGTSIVDQPLVEISFPAGSTAQMFLNGLVVSRQVTGALNASLSNGRAVTINGSVSLSANSDFRNYPSLPSTFGTNGTIVVSPETEDPSINTYAVEVWYTPSATDTTGTKILLSTGSPTISIVAGKVVTAGFANLWINRNAVSSNVVSVVPGVPMHIVASFSTPANTTLTIGHASTPVTGNVSNVGLIFQSIVLADVQALYDNQQDVPISRPTSTSSIQAVDTGTNNLGLVWSSGSQ
jgi:hypothetical protein